LRQRLLSAGAVPETINHHLPGNTLNKMAVTHGNNHDYRGLLHSGDGVITRVLEADHRQITFQAAFSLTEPLAVVLARQPEHIHFSERSRIARLGLQIQSESPMGGTVRDNRITLTLRASAAIPGYPRLAELAPFITTGLPVGRLVFCDPEALLSSDEVLAAIERADLKLPASTTISSDGSIVITPHKVVCRLRKPLTPECLGRILMREDGRELLNRYQIPEAVRAVSIAPGEGVITTFSMYLNDHYVVLQSGFSHGRNLPATVLDPIKTRGIRIYLEIVNQSEHPIINPLVTAKVYRAARSSTPADENRPMSDNRRRHLEYHAFEALAGRMDDPAPGTCHHLHRPVGVVPSPGADLQKITLFSNGPASHCDVTPAQCAVARRDFSPRSLCAHAYATGRITPVMEAGSGEVSLVSRYFPNMIEHRDIMNLASEGRLRSLYFFEPSAEHGPFLSQMDHNRLHEYHAFGLDVFWVSGLNRRVMKHTVRDGLGYFVTPERLADFHKSMFFAVYGSNRELSPRGQRKLGGLLDALITFWGRNIGIVTGGGSGVMAVVNALARERGILSGANFLDITDQSMTTDVDFCQVFQSTCRHSRQKWFELASFPIFNVGGLGTLEELGITLCNMKLSILEPVPVVLFDSEGEGGFWREMAGQIRAMIDSGRAPAWIAENIVATASIDEVIDVYRNRLQLF